MRKLKGTLLTLLAQQSGQIQLLIIAPILTLSFLSLVVRTASSAVDSSVEKRKVTEQLKRRLSEVQSEHPLNNNEEGKTPPSKVTLSTKSASSQKTLKGAPQQQAPSLAQQLLLPLQVSVKLKKRTTLDALLKSEGLTKEERALWVAAAKKQKALRRFAVGRTVDLAFALTKQEKDRELRAFSYGLGRRARFILEKKTDGKFSARKEALPVSLVWKGVGGRITGSLHKSALKVGVPKHLVDDLADLDWDINLTSDLQQGDVFKVIFEEFQLDGKPIDYGRILAAEITNRGRTYTLFSFAEPQSIAIPGSRSSRTFLRYPLQFTRITSVFTDARLHPILERVRPHTGVDFAAPRGTPVRSIAGGKITFSGRQAGYGKIVRIDHPGPYDTAYAHLDRIAESVTRGKMVEKGQVIGFVGSTGLATGPHLHFEMYKNGTFINPMTAKISTEDRLPQKENPAFAAKKHKAFEQLSAMKIGGQPIVLSMAVAQSDQSPSHRITEKGQDERLALAASSGSPSLIPGLSSAKEKSVRKKAPAKRSKQAAKARGVRTARR